jgi:hypothetical protein
MSLRAFTIAGFSFLVLPLAGLAQSADETAVRAVVQRLFDGMRSADSAMARSTFADGARFASVDTRTTPATIKYDPVDGWIRAVANSARRWDEQIYDVQIRVDGNIAQVWAPYTFYLDKAVRHCGVDSFELLRKAADWKITQLSDTRRTDGCRDVLAK